MTPLSRNDRDLIFDCCLGLTRTEQAIQVGALLTRNEKAADFHARVRAALEPLESLYLEPCPAELAERTVRLLCAAARMKTGEYSLHELEEWGQYPREFDTRDASEAAIMELSPEGTD